MKIKNVCPFVSENNRKSKFNKKRCMVKYGQISEATICPRSSDPFYMISYYMKWGKTSWTYGMRRMFF